MSNGNFNSINVKQLNFTGDHILKNGQPTMLAVLDASGVGHHKSLCVDNLAVGKGDNDCIDLNYVLDVSGASKLSGFINDSNGTTGNLGQVITATTSGWAWQDPSNGGVTVQSKWLAGNSGQDTSTIYHSNPSYPSGTDLARVGIGNFSGTTSLYGQAKATLDVDSGTSTESMRSSFKLGTISPNGVFQNAPFSAMMGDGNSLKGTDAAHGSSFVLGHDCSLNGWCCAAIGRHNVVNMPDWSSNYGSKGAIALGNYAYAGIKGGSAGTGDIGFAIGTGDEGTINGQPTYSSNNNKFVIDVSGNVGIGTNAPSAYLHVESTAPVPNYDVPQVLITADPASNYNQWASLELRGSYIGNTVPYGVGIRTTYGHDINYRTYGDFSIYTADKDNGNAKTDRLTVTSTGDIGIGTTTPQAKLDVSGSDALIHGITVGRGATDGTTTTTSQNTAVGYQALYNNTIGFNNVATGYQALNKNTTGQSNVATGMNALRDNIDGKDNIASGTSALELNTSGNENVAIGTSALLNNKTGSENTAVGYTALVDNSGVGNVAVGSKALLKNAFGARNVAIGTTALQNNTVGNNNVAIGYNAGPTTNNLSNTISIGYNAQATISNVCVIGDSNINVGIGTTSPGAKLDVSGSDALIHGITVGRGGSGNNTNTALGYLVLQNNTGTSNVAVGYRALDVNQNGSENIAIGSALKSNTSGGNNVAVGNGALEAANGTSNIAIGTNALFNHTGNSTVAMGFSAALDLVSGTNNTVIGDQAYLRGTGGSNNTVVGSNSLSFNSVGGGVYTGSTNTVVGSHSMQNITTGSDNVAVGYQAMTLVTAGNNNVAIGNNTLTANNVASCVAVGYEALRVNTADSSVAVGFQALTKNTFGVSNTAVGTNSLTQNQTGNYNTAVGFESLQNNTGDYNTAYGVNTLNKNTSGTYNIAMGNGALFNNKVGIQNVAIGVNALFTQADLSGNNNDCNTAVGHQALYTNKSRANTAVGCQAMYNNLSGIYNTALGYQALEKNVSEISNTAIGYRALAISTSGGNTAVGTNSLVSNLTGINNTAVGVLTLSNIGSGNNNVAIGFNSGPTSTGNNLSHTISIGANVKPANSNSCVIGDPSLNINVGIGTNAPQAKLDVSGNANISGELNVSLINTSAGPSIFQGKVQITHSSSTEASLDIPNGKVGIGTSSPSAKLQVVGDISCNTLRDANGNIGSSGQVLSSTGNGLSWANTTEHGQWNTAAGGIYYDSGKVGIGTNTPSETLDISGNIISNGNIFINGDSPGDGSYPPDVNIGVKDGLNNFYLGKGNNLIINAGNVVGSAPGPGASGGHLKLRGGNGGQAEGNGGDLILEGGLAGNIGGSRGIVAFNGIAGLGGTVPSTTSVTSFYDPAWEDYLGQLIITRSFHLVNSNSTFNRIDFIKSNTQYYLGMILYLTCSYQSSLSSFTVYSNKYQSVGPSSTQGYPILLATPTRTLTKPTCIDVPADGRCSGGSVLQLIFIGGDGGDFWKEVSYTP